MADETKSYKIVNTTIKEAHKKGGRDARTPAEQRGNVVTWPAANGQGLVGVGPGEMKIVAGPLTDAIFRLAARGRISITEIGDISTAVKEFEQEARQSNAAAKERAADAARREGKGGAAPRSAGATPRLDSDYPEHDANGVPSDQKAEASEMGGISRREQAERDALAADYTADNESSTVVAKNSNAQKAAAAKANQPAAK